MTADLTDAEPRELADYLLSHDRFVFTTHMTPDGDGLGSQLALLRFLRARGKDVRILNCSGVPEDLRFLINSGEVVTYQKDRHQLMVLDAEAIVAFDLGATVRLGKMADVVRSSRARRILVDHHLYENDIFDVTVLDTKASSSAEITWRIIEACGGEPTLEIAEPLYVGLLQDTGSFNYNSTNGGTHRLAAKFLDAGVDPYRIWKKLNCRKDFRRVRLMGLNISRIALSAHGRVASLKVGLEYLRENDGEPRDVFEVVNHFLTIDGVEIGLLALQIGSHKVKFSLRSGGRHDVCQLAKEFGGGGHRYAAGFTTDGMDLDAAFGLLLERVQELAKAGARS